MKKIIAVLMATLMVASIVPLFAMGLTGGNGFTYEDVNGEAVVTGYTSSTASVTIPSTINGLKVTKVANCAFTDRLNNNSADMTSLSLPSTLVTIGDAAFSTNNVITSLTIPASVETIGARAFDCWMVLSTLKFSSNTVQTIDKWAFRNNHKLANFNLPTSITKIGEGAFAYCISLTNATIPANCTSIGKDAFLACSSLKTVTIYNRDANIGENAFDLTSTSGLTITGYAGSTAEKYAKANGYTFTALPEATNIKSSVDRTNLYVGEKATITATVTPTNLANKTITWRTSNASVATVVNGVVTAKGAGTATITGTIDNQNCAYTFTVSKYTSINLQLDHFNSFDIIINVLNTANEIVKTMTVPGATKNGKVTQNIAINGLEPGNYTVQIRKNGSLGANINNVNATQNNDINVSKKVFMMPGDTNGDNCVDINDISAILVKKNFGHKVTDEGVNPYTDVEGNGVVDISDLATILIYSPFHHYTQNIDL